MAASLGADRGQRTGGHAPIGHPGVITGSALASAPSLGEFGATITFASSFPRTTQAMPSLIYPPAPVRPARRTHREQVLLSMSIVVLILLRRTIG